LAIVVEAARNLNRAIFPLKSKAKKFDGPTVGFRPSEEIFCAYKSARYDALRGSSGNEGRGIPWRALAGNGVGKIEGYGQSVDDLCHIVNPVTDLVKSLILNWLTPQEPIQVEARDGIPDGICDGHSSVFEKGRQTEPSRDGLFIGGSRDPSRRLEARRPDHRVLPLISTLWSS
jgi:hypothetical protein